LSIFCARFRGDAASLPLSARDVTRSGPQCAKESINVRLEASTSTSFASMCLAARYLADFTSASGTAWLTSATGFEQISAQGDTLVPFFSFFRELAGLLPQMGNLLPLRGRSAGIWLLDPARLFGRARGRRSDPLVQVGSGFQAVSFQVHPLVFRVYGNSVGGALLISI
jgi:hypothetical protein